MNDKLNIVNFRGSFFNLPLSAGVKFNFENHSSLSLRLGYFMDFGLAGSKKVEIKSADKAIFSDLFSTSWFNHKGVNLQVLSFNRFLTGFLFAVDYQINKRFNCSFEAQKQSLIEKGGLVSSGNLNPLNMTFSLGYNF